MEGELFFRSSPQFSILRRQGLIKCGNKDITAKDANLGVWVVDSGRTLNDSEVEEYVGATQCFPQVVISEESKDELFWSLCSKRLFSVESYYLFLTSCEEEEERFPRRSVWKVKVASKVAFFAWEAA